MKPAVAAQFMLVERIRTDKLGAVFVGVFCLAIGFLAGDWSAEPRFFEREQSLREMVAKARADVDRVRESIKRGCYEFIDPRPGSSRWAPKDM